MLSLAHNPTPLHMHTHTHSHTLSQGFGLSITGAIVFDDDLCLNVQSSVAGSSIKIMLCYEFIESQRWVYNEQVSIAWVCTVDNVVVC